MRHTSLLPVLVVATLLIASCGGGSGGGSFDSRDDGVDGGDLAQPPVLASALDAPSDDPAAHGAAGRRHGGDG